MNHPISTFTALLTLAAVLAVPSAHAQTIGWWRFDEAPAGSVAALPASMIDLAAANNGTPIGSPIYAAAINACTTGGLAFNGINDRVAVPDTAAYATLRSMTIEVELVTSGYRPSPYGLNQIVFRGDDRGSLDPFYLAIQSNGRVAFAVNNVLLVQSPSPLPVGVFVHVAATLDDASGIAKLFVNRELVASATTAQRPNTTPLTGPNPGVGFGNIQSGNYAQYFAGTIYEVRISSAALSTDAMLPAPSVLSQPATVGQCAPGATAFSLTAGGSAPFTYHWRKDTVPIDIVANPSAATAILTLANVGPGDVASYDCIVTNACGIATSNPAQLFVDPSDVGQQGGLPGRDGLHDNNDFVVYIDLFFNQQPAADLGKQGGILGSDGQFDNNDFVVFIDQFFAGCP